MYQTKTVVKIGPKKYEVGYPNVGQKLDIENLKNILTGGRYGEIGRASTITANKVLDLVDAVSFFSVLIPELRDAANPDSFTKMDAMVQQRYIKAFTKFYTEFILKVDEEINKMLDAEYLETETEVE